MSITMKSCCLALSVSALVSACNTTSVGTAQQFTAQDQQAALALITETINSQCSAEGFIAETIEHTQCFWQHAAEVRQQLAMVKQKQLEYRHRMNGAVTIADRKFHDQDNYHARIESAQRQEQIARNDGG